MSLARRLAAEPAHAIASIDLGDGVRAEFKVRRLTLAASASMGVAARGIVSRVAAFRSAGKAQEPVEVSAEDEGRALESLAEVAEVSREILSHLAAAVYASREVGPEGPGPWVPTRVVLEGASAAGEDGDVINLYDMPPSFAGAVRTALRVLEGGGGPAHPTI